MKRLALVLLLVGCAHDKPLVARSYPAPDPNALLESLRLRGEKLHALSAEARADESGPGHPRVKVKVAAWVQKPDKLRLELEGPLGTGAATLVSDGSRFQLLDQRSGRLFTGEARGCNVARLVQVELEPAQAVTVLSGEVPLENGTASLDWDGHDGGRELITIHLPDGEERIWLDGTNQAWDPTKAERWIGGKLAWRVTHSGFADVQGRRLPSHTTIHDLRRKAEIRLDWKDRELDPTLNASGFHLEPGPGVPAEVVGCQ